MRVLLMNHFPLQGSGSGVYTVNIARALVRKGHEVCIIMPENEVLAELDVDGIRLHPVYFDSCSADALDFDFPCFTTHPRSVMTFYELDDAQVAAYEGAFRAAIEDEIAAFDPDVIHCGHIWLQASYAADYGIPLIITAHGTDLIGFQKSERFREQARKAFDTADAIITISKDSTALVNKLFGEPEKVHLVRNGYDPTVFYPDESSMAEVLTRFDIDGDYDDIVSFAGKFAHFKGIDILLNAAALYERDGVATIIAGDGELFGEMTALAKELGLRHVHFVHNQPHDVLRHLYSCATVSLLTSRNEPFGLVAIEALACGAPVIASDEGGPLDIITPEVGLLFQSENPEDLAREVQLVLDGDIDFDREEVARYALENYSQDVSIGELIALYEAAIGETATERRRHFPVPSCAQGSHRAKVQGSAP